ncbi:MAG: hypothetical protein H0T79_14755 [Deltaproteobacteria bacterium]|nr:hypothetical protein [Deltaproteobacteria bacterium]
MSRTTYEKLKSFCETNNISMSQFVETRVGDFLGEGGTTTLSIPASQPRPSSIGSIGSSSPHGSVAPAPRPVVSNPNPAAPKTETRPAMPAPVPMTSAAARYAVEPPPPIIKPRQQEAAPKPAEKRADQIFTF